MIYTLSSGFSLGAWGGYANSLLGTEIKTGLGQMFSFYFSVILSFLLKDQEGDTWLWCLLLSPPLWTKASSGGLPLPWSPLSHLTSSHYTLGKHRWPNKLSVIIWCNLLECGQDILSFTIHSLLHVGKTFANSACDLQSKPIEGNHERCQFSTDLTNTEH